MKRVQQCSSIKELKNHNTGREIADWKLVKYEIRNPYRISHLVLSEEEDIISVIAHELRHQWQFSKPLKSQWSYGCQKKTSNYTSEQDASIYSIRKQREWRRLHHQPTHIYPDDAILGYWRSISDDNDCFDCLCFIVIAPTIKVRPIN